MGNGATPQQRWKILIVEDHPVIRAAYTRLLNSEPDLEVCGEATTGDQALELLATTRPHLVVIDISLPGMNGLEVLKRLKASYPDLPILVVSGHEESIYAKQALQAGARGYLDKAGLADVMIEAVQLVLQGKFYISREIYARLQKSDRTLLATLDI